MWSRRIGRILALVGLYALVLADIGTRIAGQGSSQYQVGLVEFAAVTVLFLAAAVFIVTRPAPDTLE